MVLISIPGYSLRENPGPSCATLTVVTVITEEGISDVYMRLLNYHSGI